MIRRTNNLSLATCALCRSSSDFRNSHVLPQFVFDWFKRTSATGYLRMKISPNERAQDGVTERMLCGGCEDRLSKFERQTANQIFFPLHNKNERVLKYGPWFGKFCASVVWRVLFFARSVGLEYRSTEMFKEIDDALETWRSFILDEVPAPSPFELYVVPMDAIQSTRGGGISSNFNRYLLRTIEFNVPNLQTTQFVHAKLCRLLIVGRIHWDDPKAMRKAEVNHGHGSIAQAIQIPEFVGSFLAHRAELSLGVESQISDRQMDRISQSQDENFDRTINSESFKALTRDVEMFGTDTFAKRKK